jgi:uncharacterized protein YcfJ
MAKKLKIMKKILMIITIASVFAACKSDSTDLQTNKVMLADSIGISNSSASSDTAIAAQKGANPVSVSGEKTRTSTSNSSTASKGNSTASTTTSTTTTTNKKKGWSNRAKGAVIGGVAGAVGGAIISKHKGTGAAVGAAVGAAGGYIIGNEKDKKNNR